MKKQYLSWGKKDKKNTMLLAKSQRICTGSSAKASSFPTIITSFKPNSPGDGATGYDLIFHCRVMSCDCHVTHAMWRMSRFSQCLSLYWMTNEPQVLPVFQPICSTCSMLPRKMICIICNNSQLAKMQNARLRATSRASASYAHQK